MSQVVPPCAAVVLGRWDPRAHGDCPRAAPGPGSPASEGRRVGTTPSRVPSHDFPAQIQLNPRNTTRAHDLQRSRAVAEILSPQGEPLAQAPVVNAALIDHARRDAVAPTSASACCGALRPRLRHVAGNGNPHTLSWHGLDGFLEWRSTPRSTRKPSTSCAQARSSGRPWGPTTEPVRCGPHRP